ncbi:MULTISPECIES: SGNH/GDSL hydrolase family protein [unclassified Streptomyces]|uniref:SGNH/GDSL hydrolase family protein n=1 Tax=unclassified Streptomyces TaxID=2593676 RepID=UPI000C278D45|nr:SGNH/GDSL hydrolase family protein [Streptomyces sp. CB01373]PJM91804.1 GDSL family lipase [Streptomyces sp. CB01373]
MVHSRPFSAIRRGAATLAAVTAATASLLSSGAGPAAAAGAAGPGSVKNYVALGDSYAAGTGLSGQTDAQCKRASGSYPSRLAQTYKPAVFKDVTCSGATTRSLWNTQGSAAPQVNALTQDTDLVTVTLGGNDLGFSDVITRCVLAGLSTREGAPCRDALTTQVDGEFAKLNTRLPDMLTDIKRRSPKARVVVVGYPNPFPADGSTCGSSVPLAKGDVAWLHQTTNRLNVMLALAALTKQAEYVDISSKFQGKDMCRPASEQWINPLLPQTDGSAHPNAVGHLITASTVYEQLQK